MMINSFFLDLTFTGSVCTIKIVVLEKNNNTTLELHLVENTSEVPELQSSHRDLHHRHGPGPRKCAIVDC